MDGGMSTAPTSIPALVDEQARRRGDQVALRCADAELTYRELAELSARAAAALHAHGVRGTDRIVALLGNSVEFPIALVAAARLGALLVPLNHRHRGDVLRYMVAHAEPRAVVIDIDLLDQAQRADVAASAPLATRLTKPEFVSATREAPAHPGAGHPLDPAAIIYTSGTTGRSKGAVLSQAFLLYEARAFLRVVRPTEGDVFWSALPLFHTNALCLTLLGSLVAGGRAVLRPGFRARHFWDQVRDDEASVVNLLGAMVPILLKTHPHPVLDHRVRLAVGGGVPASAIVQFRQRFRVGFREIYGLTETGLNAAQTDDDITVGSVGRALPHWDIRVDAAPGSDGEIQIRPTRKGALFDEYWRDPMRTREAFTEDGYFRTGDLGRFDPERRLSFRGRIKECIRRRGENISPTEVEFAVAEHPAIAECVAVPVPSELAEDEVKLIYVLHEGGETTEAELHEFCRARMASFMVPRYLERRDALPKTPTQKIERHLLTGLGPTVRDMREPLSSHDPREST